MDDGCTGCKGCTKRTLGCHKGCKTYKAFLIYNAVINAKKADYCKKKDSEIESCVRNAHRRGGPKREF